MSMYEQAEKIKNEIDKFYTDLTYNISEEDKVKELMKDILNTMIRFGQTAKFRCRSNVAYDNFVNACFNNVADVERRVLEGHDFKILEVVKMK